MVMSMPDCSVPHCRYVSWLGASWFVKLWQSSQLVLTLDVIIAVLPIFFSMNKYKHCLHSKCNQKTGF